MTAKPLTPLILLLALSGCVTLDEKDRQVLLRQKVSPPLYQNMLRNEPLRLEEMVELSKKNVPPSIIVRYVDNSLAEYRLRADDVVQLRRLGVRNEVIDYLLATPRLNAERAFVHNPYWWDYSYRQPIIVHHHHRRR